MRQKMGGLFLMAVLKQCVTSREYRNNLDNSRLVCFLLVDEMAS
jgi:hypothetical protein